VKERKSEGEDERKMEREKERREKDGKRE